MPRDSKARKTQSSKRSSSKKAAKTKPPARSRQRSTSTPKKQGEQAPDQVEPMENPEAEREHDVPARDEELLDEDEDEVQ